MEINKVYVTENDIIPNEHGEFDIFIRDHAVFSKDIGKICITIENNGIFCDDVLCQFAFGDGIIYETIMDNNVPDEDKFETMLPTENVPFSLTYLQQSKLIFKHTGINFNNHNEYKINIYYTEYVSNKIVDSSCCIIFNKEKAIQLMFAYGLCGISYYDFSLKDNKYELKEIINEYENIHVQRIDVYKHDMTNLLPLIVALYDGNVLTPREIIVEKVRYPMIQYGNKLVSQLLFTADALTNIKINIPHGNDIVSVTLDYDRCFEKDHHILSITNFHIDDESNLCITSSDNWIYLITTSAIKNIKLEIQLDKMIPDNSAIDIEYDRVAFCANLRNNFDVLTQKYINLIQDVRPINKINTLDTIYYDQ